MYDLSEMIFETRVVIFDTTVEKEEERNMKKQVLRCKKKLSLLLAILVLATSQISVLAADNIHPESELNNLNLEIDNSEYSEDGGAQKRTDGRYVWKVTSKTIVSRPYGSFRNGPSGKGPGTVSLTNSNTTNRSVTNTISGSYTSVGTIASSLGVTIGKSKTYSASYSISVPSGKRYQIIFRPQYKRIKVVQTQFYKIDGYETKTSQTKTSYVNVFQNWDYSWKKL